MKAEKLCLSPELEVGEMVLIGAKNITLHQTKKPYFQNTALTYTWREHYLKVLENLNYRQPLSGSTALKLGLSDKC